MSTKDKILSILMPFFLVVALFFTVICVTKIIL